MPSTVVFQRYSYNRIAAVVVAASSLLLLAISVIIIVVTVVAVPVQAQVSQPTDVEIIESDVIRKNISDAFSLDTGSPNGPKLKNYTLDENGRGEFTFEVQVHPFVFGTRDDTTTMTILMDHPWGPESGYIYNSTGVYTPDGSKRLIIATTD